jgi:hypothetical protein
MREIWKKIVIEGKKYHYSVSDQGQVRNDDTGRILKPWKRGQRKGTYLAIRLFSEGKRKTVDIQRLVAFAFIPNPHNKPEVNHINCNPFDNRIDNLEWVTRSENERHKCFWIAHREVTDWDVSEPEISEKDERRAYEERIGAVSGESLKELEEINDIC